VEFCDRVYSQMLAATGYSIADKLDSSRCYLETPTPTPKLALAITALARPAQFVHLVLMLRV